MLLSHASTFSEHRIGSVDVLHLAVRGLLQGFAEMSDLVRMVPFALFPKCPADSRLSRARLKAQHMPGIKGSGFSAPLYVVDTVGAPFDISFRVPFIAASFRPFTISLSASFGMALCVAFAAAIFASLCGAFAISLAAPMGVTFDISFIASLGMACIISFASPFNAPFSSSSGSLLGKVLCLDADRLPNPKNEQHETDDEQAPTHTMRQVPQCQFQVPTGSEDHQANNGRTGQKTPMMVKDWPQESSSGYQGDDHACRADDPAPFGMQGWLPRNGQKEGKKEQRRECCHGQNNREHSARHGASPWMGVPRHPDGAGPLRTPLRAKESPHLFAKHG